MCVTCGVCHTYCVCVSNVASVTYFVFAKYIVFYILLVPCNGAKTGHSMVSTGHRVHYINCMCHIYVSCVPHNTSKIRPTRCVPALLRCPLSIQVPIQTLPKWEAHRVLVAKCALVPQQWQSVAHSECGSQRMAGTTFCKLGHSLLPAISLKRNHRAARVAPVCGSQATTQKHI